jgi:hypothetical protein
MKPEGPSATLRENTPRGLTRRPLSPGRIGTYTVLGGAIGVVPLPWIPDSLARRLRGAVVQDLASKHGLSVTPEARAIFAEPAGTEGPRGIVAQVTRFATRKFLSRIGPLGFFAPVRSALSTFVLAHLFHRYLETARVDRSIRIDVDEARRVRSAIDHSLARTITTENMGSIDSRGDAPEDLRDSTTQLIDGVIIATAGLPAWIVNRLDAAFDEVLPTIV